MVKDADFDASVLASGVDQATLTERMNALMTTLEQDQDFKRRLDRHLTDLNSSSAGIDDEQFTMRYQSFVLRMLSPSQVFSSLLGAFKEASASDLVVGVNIVGPENLPVSMRDYALHMQMFKFLRQKYPRVKLSLHAGELALGMVQPEGLSFHIRQAIEVAGANRIGHGIDLAHETDPPGLLKEMRDRAIAVEVNLTSNEFILGIKSEEHPVTLYRKFGVPFVLATDDAGVSRNNLSAEYVLYASRYPTSYAELKKLSYDSLRYSFLSEQDKKRLTKTLDARFVKFEAAIADLVRMQAVHQ
jgi:adenosine deaminase/adenosine deaminase CECR1